MPTVLQQTPDPQLFLQNKRVIVSIKSKIYFFYHNFTFFKLLKSAAESPE